MARFGLRYGSSWIPLPEGAFVLGRSDDCNLYLDDAAASRRHAILHVAADQVLLEDTGSRNGTLLNDVRLSGSAPLDHGDRLRVGTQELVLEREDQDEDDQTDRGRAAEVGRRVRERHSTQRMLAPADVTQEVPAPEGASRPDASLLDEAWDLFHRGEAEEAAGVSSILARRLAAAGKRGKVVEAATLERASRLFVGLGEQTDRWQWVERLFEILLAHGALMSGEVMDRVQALGARLAPPRARVVHDYAVRMQARSGAMDLAERVRVRRLEGLARNLGRDPSSDPPKPS